MCNPARQADGLIKIGHKPRLLCGGLLQAGPTAALSVRLWKSLGLARTPWRSPSCPAMCPPTPARHALPSPNIFLAAAHCATAYMLWHSRELWHMVGVGVQYHAYISRGCV